MLNLKTSHSRSNGFTVIELAIVISIIGILLAIAMPTYRTWIANLQIREAGEDLLDGLKTARAEALKQNRAVLFSLTSSLDNSCVLSSTGPYWIVSGEDPTGECHADISDASAPFILRKQVQSSRSERITFTNDTNLNCIRFNGIGQSKDCLNPEANTDFAIDISLPGAGSCQNDGGKLRCLRLQLLPGGMARLCDPQVDIANNPTGC